MSRIICGLMLLMSIAGVGIYGQSLPKLTGGSGTTMPAGWKVKYWSGLETRFEVEAKADFVELRLVGGGRRFGVETELPWKPAPEADSTLMVSANCRTSDGGRGGLTVEFFNAKGVAIGERSSISREDEAWGWVDLTFRVPAETTSVKIYFLNVGTGTVQYRDSKIVKAAPLPEEYPIKYVCSPVEGNRTIYDGKCELNTFIDSPVTMCFDFWGDRFKVKNLRLVLEVPEPLGIYEMFTTHTNCHRTEVPVIEPFVRDGKKWNRYSYSNTNAFNIIGKTKMWNRQLAMAFTSPEIGEFDVKYYLCDDNSQDKVRSVRVRVLPPLESLPNPKRFVYLPWDNVDFCFPDKTLWGAFVKRFEECNMHSRPRNSSPIMQEQDKFLEARGWKMFHTEGDYLHTNPMGGVVKEYGKVPPAIMADGSVHKDRICPEFFINDERFGKLLAEMFAKRYKANGIKEGEWVLMDFEPWGTMDWCFCQVCRESCGKDFLNGRIPTIQEARGKDRMAWINYRVKQAAAVNRRFTQIVSSAKPGLKFYDYDYPINFNAKDLSGVFASCAKDPRTYEDCVEGHFSSFYHHNWKHAFDLIDINVKTLKKDVFIMPSLSRNDALQGSYTSAEETLNPRQFRQKMLAGATAGCKGMGVYPGRLIDGKFFPEINRAMAEIAALEDFFFDGQRQEEQWQVNPRPNKVIKTDDGDVLLPGWNMFCGWRAHGMKDGRRLVSCFNYHKDEEMFVDIMPQGWTPKAGWILVDFINKKRVASNGAGRWLAKVGTEDVRFFLYAPETKEMQGWAMEDYAAIDTGHKTMVARQSPPALPSVRIGSAQAGMTDIGKDGIPEVTVKTGQQEIAISTLGGAVQRWSVNGQLVSGKSKFPNSTGLLWDYLAVPKYTYGVTEKPYELKGLSVSGKDFVVSFEYRVPGYDITLRKKYLVSSDKTSMRVNYEIVNTGKESREVSLWSHSFPDMPVKSSCTEMVVGFPKYGVLPETGSEFVFTYKDNPLIMLNKSKDKIEDSTFAVWLKNKPAMKLQFQPNPEHINQFYFWRSGVTTAEFMMKKLNVPAGKTAETWIELSVEVK